jgi:hypothetical protein
MATTTSHINLSTLIMVISHTYGASHAIESAIAKFGDEFFKTFDAFFNGQVKIAQAQKEEVIAEGVAVNDGIIDNLEVITDELIEGLTIKREERETTVEEVNATLRDL